MCEVKILMSPDFQKLAQFTNIYPIGHSEIFRVPRENDVVVTDPPNPRQGTNIVIFIVVIILYNIDSYFLISFKLHKSDEDQLISQTTSQYALKHTETTQEETAAPGKLPETPLRMDPDLLYDVRYDDEIDDREQGQPDHIQMESPPKEAMSSYSVS